MPVPTTQDYFARLTPSRPLVIAVIQSFFIAGISNTVAQSYNAHITNTPFTTSFSFVTLLRFLALDLITAPPNYKWQEWLEWKWPARPENRGRGGERYEAVPLQEREGDGEDIVKDDDEWGLDVEDASVERSSDVGRAKGKLSWCNTFIKWFTDCITIGAIGNTLAFLIFMGMLKGQSPSKIGSNIRHETVTIIVNGYKIWPIANFIAHTLVPWEKKIVWFSFVGLCWNVYLSLVALRL